MSALQFVVNTVISSPVCLCRQMLTNQFSARDHTRTGRITVDYQEFMEVKQLYSDPTPGLGLAVEGEVHVQWCN